MHLKLHLSCISRCLLYCLAQSTYMKLDQLSFMCSFTHSFNVIYWAPSMCQEHLGTGDPVAKQADFLPALRDPGP